MKLMCGKCSYVYNVDPMHEGTEDPVCRSSRNPGTLVAAPDDAVAGRYYDPTKDPGINCEVRA